MVLLERTESSFANYSYFNYSIRISLIKSVLKKYAFERIKNASKIYYTRRVPNETKVDCLSIHCMDGYFYFGSASACCFL